jgi:hypothetical protein
VRAGHQPEQTGGGSPDLEIALAESEGASPNPKNQSNYKNLRIRLPGR